MKASARVVMVVMVGALEVGCVYSPYELVQKELVVEYLSPKAPRAVAGCIGDLFLKDCIQVSTVQTGTGLMIVRGGIDNYNGSHGAYGAVLIEPEGTGSRVRYGEQLYWDPDNMAERVRDCR
ncbi:hypothetical protein [Geomonas anaerohicana]|uniref:Uncharacterized protein n=1 Tax=Geomonas anaerohicana TaxID=2798583 RepID=A0ABS0YC20_9BACT|nr:hypothetical protein [Geomonas anaerohicana]MBJ6749874.1 hypothetical protein [Geomonas anaerohicana]